MTYFSMFEDRKSIHIKLSKDVHFALRAKLFKHSISMQELFDEFARMVATDTAKGQAVLNSIIASKTKSAIEGKPRKKKEPIRNFDVDALYNLINGMDEEQ